MQLALDGGQHIHIHILYQDFNWDANCYDPNFNMMYLALTYQNMSA